jgi:hypothetical protein
MIIPFFRKLPNDEMGHAATAAACSVRCQRDHRRVSGRLAYGFLDEETESLGG